MECLYTKCRVPARGYRFLPVTPGIAGCTAVDAPALAPFIAVDDGGGQHELSAQSGATQTIGQPSCSSPISAAAVAEMCDGSVGAVEEDSPGGGATISGWMVLGRRKQSQSRLGRGRRVECIDARRVDPEAVEAPLDLAADVDEVRPADHDVDRSDNL